jgi:hypothetical protein
MNTTLIILVAVALWLLIGSLWTLMASRMLRSRMASIPLSVRLLACLCEILAWPVGMIGFYRMQRKSGAALNSGRSSGCGCGRH